MVKIYEMCGTSVDKEVNGTVVEYGDAKITLARAGGRNHRFAETLSKKLQPYRRAASNGTLPPETDRKLLIEVYAETVVLGWENILDQDGSPIPCNKQNIIKVFTDLPDFFRDIQELANSVTTFREQDIDDAVKN